jgi:hypothetical protein
VDRVVSEREAAVVRTIFEQFATGAGLKKIAQTLNQQGAATPRPSKSGAAGWSPSTLKALLNRELYAGVLVTNKLKKRDKHGRHRVTKRPAAEWIRVEQRHLQIIPSALWTKVQRRLAENAAAYLRSADGRLRGRPVGSAPYPKLRAQRARDVRDLRRLDGGSYLRRAPAARLARVPDVQDERPSLMREPAPRGLVGRRAGDLDEDADRLVAARGHRGGHPQGDREADARAGRLGDRARPTQEPNQQH